MSEESVRRAGRWAKLNGKTHADNPFPWRTRKHNLWLEGFDPPRPICKGLTP